MISFLKNLFKKPEPKPRLTLPSHTQPLAEKKPKAATAKTPPAPAPAPAPAPSPATAPAPAPAAPSKQAPSEKAVFGGTPKAREEWARQAARKINPDATPEQLCGITEGMTREEISAQLAILYRRHNRAASSLEARLRDEAEIMLDVIAALRQKYGE